jgi:hypothetical protein
LIALRIPRRRWLLLKLVLMLVLRRRLLRMLVLILVLMWVRVLLLLLLLLLKMMWRLVGNGLEGCLGWHSMLGLVRDRHRRLMDRRHAGPWGGGLEVRCHVGKVVARRGRRNGAGKRHGAAPDRKITGNVPRRR